MKIPSKGYRRPENEKNVRDILQNEEVLGSHDRSTDCRRSTFTGVHITIKGDLPCTRSTNKNLKPETHVDQQFPEFPSPRIDAIFAHLRNSGIYLIRPPYSPQGGARVPKANGSESRVGFLLAFGGRCFQE